MVKWIKKWMAAQLAALDARAKADGEYNDYLMQHAGVMA